VTFCLLMWRREADTVTALADRVVVAVRLVPALEVSGEWYREPIWTERPLGPANLGQLQVRKEMKQVYWTGPEKGC
jgi:hypothetical protein